MRVLVLRAQVVEIPDRTLEQWRRDQGVPDIAYSSDPVRLADDFIADTWVEYSHVENLSEDRQHAEYAHILDETVIVEEFNEEQEEAHA